MWNASEREELGQETRKNILQQGEEERRDVGTQRSKLPRSDSWMRRGDLRVENRPRHL